MTGQSSTCKKMLHAPFLLPRSREICFSGTEERFATAVAKHCRKCSEMPIYFPKGKRQSTTAVAKYGFECRIVTPLAVMFFFGPENTVDAEKHLVAPYCAIPRDYLSDTPLLRDMGFSVSQHGQLGAIPPPPFLSVCPLEYMRSRGAIPPPQKGYLSDTCAIPYENKASGCDTPLCDTISKGYCAIWGSISHWAAKVSKHYQYQKIGGGINFLNCYILFCWSIPDTNYLLKYIIFSVLNMAPLNYIYGSRGNKLSARREIKLRK